MFIRQLTYLIALDKFRHYSRAAEHCGVSQPALSMAIRQLEDELGLPIVRRNRRVFGLTEEGQRVLVWARQTVAALDGLRQEASFSQAVAGGTLSVSVMPPALQITPLLIERLRAFIPSLRVEVSVAPNAKIIHDLKERRIQMGLVYLDQVPQTDVFETHELYSEQHFFVTSEKVQASRRDAYDWSDVGKQPLCLLGKEMRSRQIVDQCFKNIGVEPTVFLETNSLELLYAELLSGRSAGILPLGALPTDRSRLNIMRMKQCPALGVGIVRLAQPVQTALMIKSWELACDLCLGDTLES